MACRPQSALAFAAVVASSITALSCAAAAQSADPFADHIVRVVYRWDNNASWGFMVYTDRSGQRCFRFGNPGFRPKISDIMAVNHKVCFAPGQTSLERSSVSTSVTGVAGKKGETTVDSYYGGTIRQSGKILDMTFQPCSRLRGETEFRCVQPTHYVVELQGEGCEVEISDSRSNWKLVSKTCEYYAAP